MYPGWFLYHLPVNKASLYAYHVPGTVLGSGNKLMSRSETAPAL